MKTEQSPAGVSSKRWRSKNPEKFKGVVDAWRSANPEKQREYNRKSKYGIDQAQFEARLSEQDNTCPICERKFSETVLPCVDHDHKCCAGKKSCGKCIRGLLCNRCNKTLGWFQDSILFLRNALEYLNR